MSDHAPLHSDAISDDIALPAQECSREPGGELMCLTLEGVELEVVGAGEARPAAS